MLYLPLPKSSPVKKILFAVIAPLLLLSFAADKNPAVNSLKINQIQIIATHNSYHKLTDPAVLRFLRFMYAIGLLPRDLDPKGIDYTKDSLSVQLGKYGVHGLEMDVWNDPEGGHFYYRHAKAYAWKRTASGIEALKQPGFKMLHIPDFDFISTNWTFKDGLDEIKRWSDANPEHLPVFINVETETDAPGNIAPQIPGLVKAVPFDSLAAENLDREVKSVFGNNLDGVITPDRLRGNHKTLEEAALNGSWPTIAQARGKIIFIIDGDGNSADVYRHGHPSLQDRAMFVYSPAGTPEAAFVICNDAQKQYQEIRELVKKGYIVRTRSDDGTTQARDGDYSDMNKAINSGAQIISTDYYKPDARAGKRGWTNFHVCFANGTFARFDSLSSPGLADPGLIQ